MIQKFDKKEFVELLVDTGATEHVCGPQDFAHAALTSGPRPALKTATGELLKHCGLRTVDFRCQGEELRVGFTVVDVKATNPESLSVDGQRHRNGHPHW